MEALDLPEGVGSEVVATPRLATHILKSGPENGVPVLFLHGRPGERGMNNALSPKYCNLEDFALVEPGPPVLWIRGDDDAIVSDTSLLDFGFLGQLDAIPGWPGAEVFPPQPMVSQMRAVLDAYEARGGRYREEVIPDCGHTPHVEKPEEFRRLLFGFLEEHDTGV